MKKIGQLSLALILILTIFVSCAAPTAQPAPGPTAAALQPSPTPADTATAVPTAVATPVPTAAATAAPTATTAPTATAIPTLPPAPTARQDTPVPTSATRVPATPAPATPIPADQSPLLQYRGASFYQPEPLFEVSYAGNQWKLVDTHLENQALAGCNLFLKAGGFGAGEPAVPGQAKLGSYTWDTKAFAQAGIRTYALTTPDGQYYLMHLRLPPNATANVAQSCQSAAEKVLGTFTLLK